MGIKYSGAAKTGTFDGSTRLSIVDGLKAALVDAGWSVASGSSGDWKLNSGITPSGHQIRIRLYDPGGTNQSARARLMNVSETIAPAQDVFLRAVSGRVYRWFANPYQFFVIAPGTVAPGSYLAGGIPWLPSFLSPANVGWLGCSAMSDTDTSDRHSFRASNIAPYHESVAVAAIYGASGWGAASLGNVGIAMAGWRVSGTSSMLRQWIDGSVAILDPLIGWGPTGAGDTARLIGQLWDAIVVEGDWPMDAIINFDGKQWWCIYYRRTGGQSVTLAVVYPTT
jgi:hypothetical protein